MDLDSLLLLLATARVAEDNWYARPDLEWLSFTFDESAVSVLPASAPLRQVSTSGEQVEESGMAMKRPVYHGNFTSRGMSKAYTRKT